MILSNTGIRVRSQDFQPSFPSDSMSPESKLLLQDTKTELNHRGHLNLVPLCNRILEASPAFLNNAQCFKMTKKVAYRLTLEINAYKMDDEQAQRNLKALIDITGLLTSGPERKTMFLQNKGWNLIKSALDHLSESGEGSRFFWTVLAQLVEHSERFANSLTLLELLQALLRKNCSPVVLHLVWERILVDQKSSSEAKQTETGLVCVSRFACLP